MRIVAALLAALLLALPPTAAAQPQPTASPAPDVPALEETVVTTTRSQSRRLENPGNIAVLTPTASLSHAAQELNRAPGTGLTVNNGQEHLTAIRSPVLTAGAGAGSFLFLEDGIALRAAPFANVNALIEALPQLSRRVELVRGPASALYGANAVHGLVNFISPSPFAADSWLETRYGQYQRLQTHVSTARQAGPWGARLSASFLHDGGYRDRSGGRQFKARLQLARQRAQQSLRWQFSAVDFYQRTAGYVVGRDAYRNERLARSNPQADSNPQAERAPAPYRRVEAWRGALFWTQELSARQRLRVTPYWRLSRMNFLMHFLPGDPVENNQHWSLGMQSTWDISFALGPHLFLGLDWEVSRGTLVERQNAPDTRTRSGALYRQGVHYDYAVRAGSLAPFLHAVVPLGQRLDLIVGTRLEWTQYDYDNRADGPMDFGSNRRPADRSDSYLTVSPKAGLHYAFADHWRAFLNYARATRPPQASDAYRLRIAQTVGEVRSEELDSVELGLRRVRGARRLELTGFYMQKRNFYFRDADDMNVPNGRTLHYGVELDLAWPLLQGLAFAASATYARHVYDFNRPVSRNVTESISKGDDVDGAPRTLANLRVIWQPRRWLQLTNEWEHVGAYYMDASNQHRYQGHDLWHAELRLQPDEPIEFYLTIRNLLNRRYASRADFWFGNERYFGGEPVSVYGGLKLRW